VNEQVDLRTVKAAQVRGLSDGEVAAVQFMATSLASERMWGGQKKSSAEALPN